MANKIKIISFKVGHLNVRSSLAGFAALTHMVLTNSYDVFLVTETWLSQVVLESVVISGYRLFCEDWVGRGGGVGIYVKSVLICNQISLKLHTVGGTEYLWVCIKFKKSSIAFGVVYRPPHTNIQEFVDTLDNILPYLVPSHYTIIATGDIDVNLFNLNNSVSQVFDAYVFFQIINEPTCITQFPSTLIDPMFISDQNLVHNCGTLNADIISDHQLNVCEINIQISKSKQKMHSHLDFKYFKRSFSTMTYILIFSKSFSTMTYIVYIKGVPKLTQDLN